MYCKIKNFIKCSHAVVLIEFALTFPIMLLLVMGTIEVSHFIYVIQKHYSAGYIAAQLSARLTAFYGGTDTDLGHIAILGGKITDGNLTNFGIVITFVQNVGGITHVVHQYKSPGAASVVSKFGAFTPIPANTNNNSSWANGNRVNDLSAINNYPFQGIEQIVVVETAGTYTPLLIGTISNGILPGTLTLQNRIHPTVMRSYRMFSFPNGGTTML